MSIFEELLAFLPAVAAVIVVLAALADRREASAVRDLCVLCDGVDHDTHDHGASRVA
jgi:hypothetical protein